MRYKLVCEQNVFCYPDVRTYVYKANYPKSLPLLLQNFSIWNSLSDILSAPLFVATISIHLCCLRRWISSWRSPLQRIFRCHIFPLRGLTIRRSCVCCSVCMRNGLRFTDSKHCFADDENTALHECFGHWWEFEIAFSRMLPRNKNVPWRQLLYDLMADTIGYIGYMTLQLARTHVRFTHCARASCATRLIIQVDC